MNPELLLLAIASTFRIASLAAVYALVQRESAAKLLLAYIIAGLTFVFAIGALIVLALHGVEVSRHETGFRRVAEFVAGGALAVLAIFAFAGRLPTDAPRGGRSEAWGRRLDEHVGVRGAAFAGVVTHVPGVFYLVALDLIIAGTPQTAARELRETAVFDLLWFALPIAVLLTVAFRPQLARDGLDAFRRFGTEHAAQIIGVVSAALGIVLLYDAFKG